ncbi:MAG: hypothetical protein Q8K98_11775 [Bacteroidota bacterium]|nr:hypothetical protein [Bacteroidota bacterium]
MNFYEIFEIIVQCIIGIASIAIAYYVYKLEKQKRLDAWYKTFNELHQYFWNDADFTDVRSIIANNDKYNEIDIILKKRLAEIKNITQIEYKALEKMDKFFNFMLRAHEVTKELRQDKNLWRYLYFHYWINEIINAKRYSLYKYYERFYISNGAELPLDFTKKEIDNFSIEAEKSLQINKKENL